MRVRGLLAIICRDEYSRTNFESTCPHSSKTTLCILFLNISAVQIQFCNVKLSRYHVKNKILPSVGLQILFFAMLNIIVIKYRN